MSEALQKVDHSAIRTNQATIITLILVAFVLNVPWLELFVGLVMLLGTLIIRRPGFGYAIYGGLLKPAGIARPDVIADNPEPHLFAQGFGGVVLVLGFLALLLGATVPGWALAWIVLALAALNLFGGFCVGCAIYYWLNRLNVPGFVKAPPAGTFPGMRPRGGQHAS